MVSIAVITILLIITLLLGFCAYCLGFSAIQRLKSDSPQYRLIERYMRWLQGLLIFAPGMLGIAALGLLFAIL